MSVTYGQQEGVGGCHRDGRQHKQRVHSMGGPGAGQGGDEDADVATLDMTLVTMVAAAQAAAIMMVSDGGPSWVIFSARRVDNPVHAEQR